MGTIEKTLLRVELKYWTQRHTKDGTSAGSLCAKEKFACPQMARCNSKEVEVSKPPFSVRPL